MILILRSEGVWLYKEDCGFRIWDFGFRIAVRNRLYADIEFHGFINDDTIPVGRVHIGLLYIIRVSNRGVYIKETDKMTAEWIDRPNLAEFYEGMETWSKIAFDF